MDKIMFAVELVKDEKSLNYLLETKKRLSEENFVQNPFKGKIKVYIENDKVWAIFNLKPIYPDLSILGLLVLLASFVIGGFSLNWGVYVGVFISLFFSFLWSKYFFIIMMKLGLIKAKVKGKLKVLSNTQIVERLMDYAD